MSDDVEYLTKYNPDTLYTYPIKSGKGTFVTLIDDNEKLLLQMQVTERSRLAISVFYANDKKDFSSITFTRLKFHQTRGWHQDSENGKITINQFQLTKIKQFLALLASIDLKDATKTKISIKELDIHSLSAILNTIEGAELLKHIANNPEVSEDIYAIAHKKAALEEFRQLLTEFESFKPLYIKKYRLNAQGEENIWQHFFEQNPWIFGHGLNYVFLDKTGQKLESITTGCAYDTSGKRVDALMRTRAAISQFVLIEIKTPSTPLLKSQAHRAGCWAVSSDLSDAITQIQKTAFDFTTDQYHKIQIKDHDGRITGEEIFRIQPKSYLVIGNLGEMKGHDDKFACFHLYRTSLNTPEILTYDELYERAKCIVETISGKNLALKEVSDEDDNEIPF